ncbi:hypothetical protein SASPL_129462 [Salvia splendens]|uniref:C2H2-type domain-containing protein n=1 Tax=Salvia splendens TaxID=180675 RepID=A0A8X8XCT1_SALSN|nr:zinc finger protein 13-like [Salvia splendens]KAG6411381.1 hypothetical protein SASPL_129462 [Salvia splendens]
MLIVKLKIPAVIRFECSTCARSFSSPKALGGHARIHMEKKNKRNHESMELQGEENGEKTLIPCPVCHQPFPTHKSLHGHMRKHPDRGWKGMRPPTPPEDVRGSPQPLDHKGISPSHDLISVAKGKSVTGEDPLLVNGTRGDFHHKIPIVESQNSFSCEICAKSHHGDGFTPSRYIEQSEGFAGISGRAKDEVAKVDQPKAPVFDFDLNELPKWDF